MLDLTIRGGLVVSPTATLPLDVGIVDGKVAVLASRGTVTLDSRATIDATGTYVVPGGIDSHVHFDLNLTETMRAQTSERGSRAAAYGGTTTFIDFALQQDDGGLLESIEARRAVLTAQRPHVDYALHAMITGEAPMEVLEEIPEAIAEGVNSFKMFTTFSGKSASGTVYTDDGRIWGVMEQTARHDGIAMVHCEDNCIIDFCVRRLYREGREQAVNVPEARPNLCEEAAIGRMLLLSRRSGSPLYIVHVSTHEGIAAITEARHRGVDVYGEALHLYLCFTKEAYKLPNGAIHHNYPTLKAEEDRLAIWEALRAGVLDTVSSDDYTVPLAAKLAGLRVDNLSGGHNGVETRMGVVFSEGVARQQLTVNRFVEVTSTAPARLFGLYPRKGIIEPGSDADIVLIDPHRTVNMRQADLHSDCDYSVWDGWTFAGYPTTTILRGEVLVRDGVWVGPEGQGQFVPARRPAQPRP